MKIVVLDTLPFDAGGELDWSPLAALGALVTYPRTRPEEAAERISDADVAYTNKVPLRAEQFATAPRLKLVSVFATGYDIVDVAAARERGVTVCNVPGYSTPSTAQTAIALLLELANGVGHHAGRVQGGAWTAAGIWSFWDRTPVELDGKTLAVVGLGAVGGQVARIAEVLGMRVIAAQVPGRETAGGGPYPRLPLGEAFRQADAISLHCPLTPATRGLLNAERLALLRPSALIVNTARGGLADEAAVADALRTGRLAGYAADVLSTEPPTPDNPLLSAPNCLITPHYAWASLDSRRRLLAASVANLRAFLDGSPQNVVS